MCEGGASGKMNEEIVKDADNSRDHNVEAGTIAVCQICNEKFVRSARGQKFCSRACSSKSARMKEYGVCKCGVCGKEYMKRYVQQSYCSIECRKVKQKETGRAWALAQRNKKKAEKVEEIVIEKPKHVDTTAEILAEARRRGVSYGKMQAMKYMGRA